VRKTESFGSNWVISGFDLRTISASELAEKAKDLGGRALRQIATLVTPETLLAWHDGSGRRGPGRPRVMSKIRKLIVEMARRNRSWGYTRIQGALNNLGVLDLFLVFFVMELAMRKVHIAGIHRKPDEAWIE
jgi:hypothetical protein